MDIFCLLSGIPTDDIISRIINTHLKGVCLSYCLTCKLQHLPNTITVAPIVTRILLFCLIPAGIYLLVIGIKWIRKALGGAVLLDIPLRQSEAIFTVEKEGNYAIWQKGRFLGRVAVTVPLPTIYNEQTGEKLRLDYPFATVRSNNGSTGKIRMLTFYASAGKYHYQLFANTFEQNNWLDKNRSGKKSNIDNLSLEIKESRPAIWLVLGILILILSAFCIISGLVFTLNPGAIS